MKRYRSDGLEPILCLAMVNVIHFEHRGIRREQLARVIERNAVKPLVSGCFFCVPFEAHVLTIS